MARISLYLNQPGGFMKFYTLILLVLTFNAIAEEEGKFLEHKKMMLENMSAQIVLLQNTKSCIESAADHPAIKKCHEGAKVERSKLESQKIDQQLKLLEEKKQKLLEKKAK
jgi:hypothetical protein